MSASIDLDATLFSGQTFAWSKQDGVYQAVVGRQLVCFTEKTFDPLLAQNGALRRYFDMDWEYGRAESYLSSLDPHLARAIQAYKGLHILNQDPWEVLMGFLLSQNNNIKRIRGMYELLSKHFGTHVEGPWYAFPRPEQLMNVSEQDSRQLVWDFEHPICWMQFRIMHSCKPSRTLAMKKLIVPCRQSVEWSEGSPLHTALPSIVNKPFPSIPGC